MLLAFIIVHLYLITTGGTITSNLKAMITGFEDIEDHKTENENTIDIGNIKTQDSTTNPDIM
jgi:hypothetical protein